jgi:hypothetical protein
VSQAIGTRWFREAGGVSLNLPPAVSGRFLSFAEREDIAIWHAQKAGGREIARRLGRAPSTISRELRRNASTRTWRLDYRASVAQWHAERRARRPRVSRLAADERLREYVQDRLGGTITPSGRRPRASPGGASQRLGKAYLDNGARARGRLASFRPAISYRLSAAAFPVSAGTHRPPGSDVCPDLLHDPPKHCARLRSCGGSVNTNAPKAMLRGGA